MLNSFQHPYAAHEHRRPADDPGSTLKHVGTDIHPCRTLVQAIYKGDDKGEITAIYISNSPA